MIFETTRAVISAIFPNALFSMCLGFFGSTCACAQQTGGTPQFYTQGEPSSEEQYLLQKLNAARLDPVSEGQRLAAWLRNTTDGKSVVIEYHLSPDQIASDLAALPAVPPLAFDPNLLAAARRHSDDMAAHNNQDHTGSDGSTPPQRVKQAGYKGVYVGENAAIGEKSLDTLHAGYLVDWGVPSLGHRRTSMNGNSAIKVVGMGVRPAPATGTFADTEDYGSPGLMLTPKGDDVVNADVPALLTGAVYDDANANGQYDPGEGIAGANVTMDGGSFYTVTSASGGYALPLTRADGSFADGPVTVRVALPNGESRVTTVSVGKYTSPITNFGPYRANVQWNVTASLVGDLAATLSGGGTASRSTGNAVRVVVHRPVASDASLPIDVRLRYTGTAVAGVDYETLPASVTIPAGVEKAKLKIKAQQGDSDGPRSTALTIRIKGQVGAKAKVTVTLAP